MRLLTHRIIVPNQQGCSTEVPIPDPDFCRLVQLALKRLLVHSSQVPKVTASTLPQFQLSSLSAYHHIEANAQSAADIVGQPTTARSDHLAISEHIAPSLAKPVPLTD